MCTTNRYNGGGVGGVDHWTEAEWVCLESLHGSQKRALRHRRRSWYSLVNKVRVWCGVLPGSYYNSICVLSLQLKWTSTSQHGREIFFFFFYPDSAFLVQNCQHLDFSCEDSRHTACRDGQNEHRHEARTLTEPLNSNVSQARHTVVKK